MTDNNFVFFEIHLKALSFISITKRNYNILSETYTFIPAWTMWNTFVKLYKVIKKTVNYEEAKRKLKNIRLTNFYLIDENNNPLFNIDENEKRKYISSELKTAINPLTNTYLEGSLYEREYLIAQKFIGWVRINKDDEDIQQFFMSVKNTIAFIGADKNSGFGKVKFEEVSQISFQEEKSNNFIILALTRSLTNKCRLPIEAKIDIDNNSNKSPFVEDVYYFPLVLREWDDRYNRGSGMKIKNYSLDDITKE